MKLFYVLITALCCAIYGYSWYLGELIPAWMALIWCFSTFMHELHNYLETR
jgi:hypothetical protein